MGKQLIFIIGMLIALMMAGFAGLAEASTGSIIDTFTDENLIASKINLELIAGQVELDATTSVYEQDTTGYNSAVDVWGHYWAGQTFTPQAAHSINKVKVRMYKTNNPGTLYVDLFLTAGGLPTGSSVASGSISANGFTENTNGAWYEVSLSTPYSLLASTQYAIALHSTGDQTDKVLWKAVGSNNYSRGMLVYSSGGAWGSNPSYDCMFEEWGDAYYSSGSFVSANLLEGLNVSSIPSFEYTASSIPSGSSLKVQFSQDNTNWYNSSGSLGGWDTLSAGENLISLSSLGWSGESFYYKTEFTSTGLVTSMLDQIKVNYNLGVIPEPASLLLLGFGVAGIAVFRKKIHL